MAANTTNYTIEHHDAILIPVQGPVQMIKALECGSKMMRGILGLDVKSVEGNAISIAAEPTLQLSLFSDDMGAEKCLPVNARATWFYQSNRHNSRDCILGAAILVDDNVHLDIELYDRLEKLVHDVHFIGFEKFDGSVVFQISK